MKLSSYTKPELEVFKDNCNFTDDELEIFNFLSSGKSIVYISEKMQYSTATINRKIRGIRNKINKIDKGMC